MTVAGVNRVEAHIEIRQRRIDQLAHPAHWMSPRNPLLQRYVAEQTAVFSTLTAQGLVSFCKSTVLSDESGFFSNLLTASREPVTPQIRW